MPGLFLFVTAIGARLTIDADRPIYASVHAATLSCSTRVTASA